MRLKGKRAIVTGASRGIGRAIALRLAEEGADLVVNALHAERLAQVVKEVESLGRRAIAVPGDVGSCETAKRLVDAALTELGGLEILVNVAGINRDAMLHKMTRDQWDEVLRVNLIGTFNTTQAAAIHMREAGYGRIINISSMSWLGNIGQANYAASKAGIVGLSKTAARELAKKGVTVNVVCPGFIDTDMTRALPQNIWQLMMDKIPMGQVGDPRDVANLVAFLASDEARYLTGEVINVSGGMVL
ncbi:MAG: 3-oxoacyl-ACP reductase FabG [Bacillota bacterium]|nr:3-oxoacyl-ACP reductase FabG [Bacillota bacterium]